MSLRNSVLIIFLVLVIDQFSKIYVKTNFIYGEAGQIEVANWFKLLLIENEGMAWGAKIPGDYGKLILTIFRIFAVGGIAYWLYDSSKKHSSNFLMVAISLIFAGAVGNIIDSIFYGVVFDDSYNHLAVMFSENSYGTWFHGKVVDMFYFPIIQDYPMPEWVPFIGGKPFTFFNAIFNVADVAISTGVGILIVFNKKAFTKRVSIGTNERFE
ncbi:lipoprotein signal peptidase [Flavobacterium sp.]|uniref:lipoprotein signal peptidase n=1 Tax=Flavobacterium sp. TaxID=239 RepID=UPI002BF1ED82|nr:lipoprotein signal peptidase [Flavobacterium sp.]HQA73330.1 lipoprotein signal peptidase [Flavobacterium sp.]